MEKGQQGSVGTSQVTPRIDELRKNLLDMSMEQLVEYQMEVDSEVARRGEVQYSVFNFFHAQREWSYKTFGPPSFRGPVGPLKHLEKEAREAYTETDKDKQHEEIADCLFLVFDAAHRSGLSLLGLARIAHAKLAKNMERDWGDWRTKDPEQAVEHNRSKDNAVEFAGTTSEFAGWQFELSQVETVHHNPYYRVTAKRLADSYYVGGHGSTEEEARANCKSNVRNYLHREKHPTNYDGAD